MVGEGADTEEVMAAVADTREAEVVTVEEDEADTEVDMAAEAVADTRGADMEEVMEAADTEVVVMVEADTWVAVTEVEVVDTRWEVDMESMEVKPGVDQELEIQNQW